MKDLMKFQKMTYQDEPSMKKRLETMETYKGIEKTLNSYYEGQIIAQDMAKFLGNTTLGINAEHPSAQIYAYECLLKSLAETDIDNKPDVETIGEEILFDAGIETNPMKRAYLLGLLHYYSDSGRADHIERKLSSGEDTPANKQLTEHIKIIGNLKAAAKRLIEKGNLMPEIEAVAQKVLADFPPGEDENEAARLVAYHYAKEPLATRPPDPSRKSILSDDQLWAGIGGNGIPRYVYTLRPGADPSSVKLEEADNFGIQLDHQMALFEGNEKIYVSYDINPELSRLYNRRIRHYKDKGRWDRVELLNAALKERVWRDIISRDPQAAEVFGSQDNIAILKRTIRDWSEDSELRNLLEQDANEERRGTAPGRAAA